MGTEFHSTRLPAPVNAVGGWTSEDQERMVRIPGGRPLVEHIRPPRYTGTDTYRDRRSASQIFLCKDLPHAFPSEYVRT